MPTCVPITELPSSIMVFYDYILMKVFSLCNKISHIIKIRIKKWDFSISGQYIFFLLL